MLGVACVAPSCTVIEGHGWKVTRILTDAGLEDAQFAGPDGTQLHIGRYGSNAPSAEELLILAAKLAK
jgi:hypothetical protein